MLYMFTSKKFSVYEIYKIYIKFSWLFIRKRRFDVNSANVYIQYLKEETLKYIHVYNAYCIQYAIFLYVQEKKKLISR
jgi:hypothetical protein